MKALIDEAAVKQALDLVIMHHTDSGYIELRNKVRSALREALAEQPAQQEQVAPTNDGFLQGICVALQAVTGSGDGVLWREIVEAAGADDLFQYAAHVEPEEWELAGFVAFAKAEMRRGKPKKLAKQATTVQKRPINCGTGYCSCIECVMEPAQSKPLTDGLDVPMLTHCMIAVRDWLGGGCDIHDIPRPEIAALVVFADYGIKENT